MENAFNDDKKFRLGWIPSTKDSRTDEASDAIPSDQGTLRAWLKERLSWLEALEELQRQFLKTRDITLLDQFAEHYEQPKIHLKTPIGQPSALFNEVNFLEVGRKHDKAEEAQAYMKQMKDDIKLLFPNVEVREVETANGEKWLAFVGAEWDEIAPALELRREQRKTKTQIECGTERLALITAGQPGSITLSEDVTDTPGQSFPSKESQQPAQIPRK